MTYTRPDPDLTRPTLAGTYGMAASTHYLATATAQAVLERGGNAFDAAVAAGFVLHVVEPHQNGAGGDMVALIAPAGRDVSVLAGQGPAPERATIEHFRAAGLTAVPGAGALAAAVPGAVEAWLWLLTEHGTWDVADVLGYAIGYAEDGHPASPQLCAVIADMAGHFAAHWPTSAAQWCPGGRLPRPGETITLPAYARTLRALVEAAGAGGRTERIANVQREWRTGLVATEAVRFAAVPHRHSSGGDHAGVLTAEDFARFAIRPERPLALDFRGRTVVKAGFWSQGPVQLQALAILDTFGEDRLDPSTALGAHTAIEALKLALSDRDAYYGDTDPPARSALLTPEYAARSALLTPEYAARRARLIGETAAGGFRPGTVDGLTAYRPALVVAGYSGAGTGEPTRGPGDTVHLDVADRFGNLISATPSGGWLQSNPTIPALGFCLGTRLQMTWLDPASPSALTPGRRPRTTLSPTMVLERGVPVAALGTPGGDQQDQWQLLYLLRTLVGGYAPQAAIDAPALHTTAAVSSFDPRVWEPAGVVAESRLGDEVLNDLRRRGHRVRVTGPWELGRLSAVTRDPATGVLGAAANPRGAQGYAAGR